MIAHVRTLVLLAMLVSCKADPSVLAVANAGGSPAPTIPAGWVAIDVDDDAAAARITPTTSGKSPSRAAW